jgi:hypothetical protein
MYKLYLLIQLFLIILSGIGLTGLIGYGAIKLAIILTDK